MPVTSHPDCPLNRYCWRGADHPPPCSDGRDVFVKRQETPAPTFRPLR